MTKETANIIGLLINILIVAMLTFIDDYVYKTLNIDYLKFEFQDSFLWNTTHAVLGDIGYSGSNYGIFNLSCMENEKMHGKLFFKINYAESLAVRRDYNRE